MRTSLQKLSATYSRLSAAAISSYPGCGLLLLFFLLVVVFVNPVREFMIYDDWAYGLSVHHLLTTGEYQLHDWAAPNMPVQIYWGAFLAQLFGYSFAVLRFSTLILLLIGLVALYRLLRDFEVRDMEASLLTLVMFSSPAVLFLSFTFQTDVQFLSWQILALWLYSRALQRQSYSLMALASVAAFASVGTRQFGATLVAGLLATWLLFEEQRFRKLPLYVLGVVLPGVMTLWQLRFGVSRPTFSHKVVLAEQLAYLRDLRHFVMGVLWRPSVILQYVALFLLPLLPLLFMLVRTWRGRQPDRLAMRTLLSRSNLWLLGVWVAYLMAAICFGYFFYLRRVLMPYLAWLLPNAQNFPPVPFKTQLVLTLVTSGFAVVFGWLFSRRYLDRRNWQLLPSAEWFVLLSGLALFGLQLIYVQFYDVYLIQFLPFALFAFGRMGPMWPSWLKTLTPALCLVMLCISALWTRGKLEQAQVSWKAAELVHSAGVPAQDVGGNRTWSCYHGAFDEWIAEIGGSNASSRYNSANRMHFAFFDFLKQRFDHAEYLVTPLAPSKGDTTAQLLGKVEYRDGWLHTQTIYLIRRLRSE